MAHSTDDQLLTEAYARLRTAVTDLGDATLPAPGRIEQAVAALPRPGDRDYLAGRGPQATLDHIVGTVVPALAGQSRASRYYGFVTGGVLPVAEAADNVVSALDANVQVHLPSQTVCTAVEDAALQMLADALALSSAWTGRTFTTGATASNVLGLALGREHVVGARLRRKRQDGTVADLGLLAACAAAGVREIRILTSMAHSSLYKAASLVGLGRRAVVDLPQSAAEPWQLDLDAVERALAAAHASDDDAVVHIIAVSAGEVNTGRFATTGRADMARLRSLADAYDAWIHVDGAFGLFARALPDTPEFALLRQHADGLELADSITSDAHKLLNVPYDAGIFFSRHRLLHTAVFQNPSAAYLASAPSTAIASPLNMGIENSRRFRALPVYAVLLSEGRAGLAAMLARMVQLAREIRRFVRDAPAYELLDDGGPDDATHIVVLFRARDEARNQDLAARINATRQVYVSPTQWQGRPAVRVAVSTWRVDVARDAAAVQNVLTAVA